MKKAGIAGIVFVALAVLLSLRDMPAFFQSYLQAFIFWMALPLGAMALRMIHHLTGGGWGRAIGSYLDACVRTMPLIALLFIPIAFGVKSIFPWAHEAAAYGHEAAAHALTGFKASYLTVPGFLIRAGVCFAVWTGLSFILTAWSHTARHSEEAPAPLQGISGLGVLAYVLTMTVASIDWGMSLEPHWFSTIYGALFMVGQGLAALAFGIIVTGHCLNASDRGEQTVGRTHDLGNLLLAFTMLWIYMVLSQFLIIWSANLPEENIWYLVRAKGGWKEFGVVMLALQFVIPFFLLLFRALKRNAKSLAKIAMLVFVVRYVELTWLIKPAFHASFSLNLTDLLLWAGLGGIWLAVFSAQRAAIERHS